MKINPGEWRTWHYLINFLQSNGAYQKELENSREAYSRFSGNPVIGTDFAKALLNTGKYSECLKVLEKVKILPQEGAHEGHDIYELANLFLAVDLAEKGKYRDAIKYVENSEKWPENLGAGKPYVPDTRLQDYISAYCYEMLDKKQPADDCYKGIMNYSLTMNELFQDPANIFIANNVLINHGRKGEADQAIARWKTEQDSLYNWKISSGSSSPKAQWLIAINKGDEAGAEKLEKQISSDPAENRFRLFLRTYNNFKKIKR